MTAMTGITQEDAYLTVFDPPGGAAILALDAGRMGALFDKAGFINDKNTLLITQMFSDIVA